VEADAGLDGVGFQGHMWHRSIPSGQNVLDDLAVFEPYGIKAQITEFTVNERFSEEEEARYLDELLHAWFSHPITDGFIMWGFQDTLIWTDNAPLFRADWSLKPSGVVWMEKVYGEWWTEADITTDENGEAQLRGFKGDYQIEVRHAGRKKRGAVTLTGGQAGLNVRLDDTSKPDHADNRLGSLNPYTTGKLPPIIPVEEDSPENQKIHVLETAAMARVGGDLYLRFPVPASTALNDAALILSSLKNMTEDGRLEVYALSPRFVQREDELSMDWDPATLTEDNAPGRSAADGGFDLGDARVLFLGDLSLKNIRTGSRIEFSGGEFDRLVRQSAGKPLTLIVREESGDGNWIAGTGTSFMAPSLNLVIPGQAEKE